MGDTDGTTPPSPPQPEDGNGALPDDFEGPTDFYKVLQVEPTATPEEIRRAYRKLALIYHPDKNPGNEKKFAEITAAHEVLSNPRQRTVYDGYGWMGLQLYRQFGEKSFVSKIMFNPSFACCFVLIMTIVTGMLITFPAFLSVKIDHKVSWTWPQTFAPLWVIDGIILLYVLSSIRSTCSPPHDEDDHTDRDPDDPTARLIQHERTVALLDKLVSIACIFAFQILIVVHLETGSPSWINVWIPLFVWEFFNLLFICMTLWRHLSPPPDLDIPRPSFTERLVVSLYTMRFWIFRTILIIFLALRSDNIIGWNWALVALPFFIGLATGILLEVAGAIVKMRMNSSDEERSETIRSLILMVCITTTCSGVTLAFVALLIERLNDGALPSMSTVFVPVFIVTGFLFCCCCCCLPCLLCLFNGAGIPEEAEDTIFDLLRPRLYIEDNKTGAPQPNWTVNMV